VGTSDDMLTDKNAAFSKASSSGQSDANEGMAVATGYWRTSDQAVLDLNSESGINQIPQTEGEEFFQLSRSSDILNPLRCCNSRAEAYRKIA